MEPNSALDWATPAELTCLCCMQAAKNMSMKRGVYNSQGAEANLGS